MKKSLASGWCSRCRKRRLFEGFSPQWREKSPPLHKRKYVCGLRRDEQWQTHRSLCPKYIFLRARFMGWNSGGTDRPIAEFFYGLWCGACGLRARATPPPQSITQAACPPSCESYFIRVLCFDFSFSSQPRARAHTPDATLTHKHLSPLQSPPPPCPLQHAHANTNTATNTTRSSRGSRDDKDRSRRRRSRSRSRSRDRRR